MERLTEKGNYSNYVRKLNVTSIQIEQKLGQYEDLGFTPEEIAYMAKFYKEQTSAAAITADLKIAGALVELDKYKKAEEQGLLLQLPCKVGSLVYKIKKDLNQMKHETIEHNGHYYHRNIDVYFITQVTFEIEDIAELGKTIFLTRAEAEKVLEEMRGKQKC